jgi:hypothetical protein
MQVECQSNTTQVLNFLPAAQDVGCYGPGETVTTALWTFRSS